MSDTPRDVEARYEALLLARSGEERLRMAGSMYSSARSLVEASIRAGNPTASPVEVRQSVFLRFYGHEFDAPTRARILDRIARDAQHVARPLSRGRPVPVDWDALELALTLRTGDLVSYLDVRTGEIRLHEPFGRGDAGEVSDDVVEEGLAAGTLLHVQPIESSVEFGWMERFARTITDEWLREQAVRALHGRKPFRRFKDALGHRRPEQERWFAFHEEQVRAAARGWLEDHGLVPTTSPRAPTKQGG